MLTAEFAMFICEREAVRLRRAAGAKPPWALDPILNTTRFTNVRREDDAVTIWLRENWRLPNAKSPMLPAGMVLARFVNYIPSLAAIGDMPYDAESLAAAKQVLALRRALGEKIWTSAYTISTNGRSMDKLDYVFDHVLDPVYRTLHLIMEPAYAEDHPLAYYHAVLSDFAGLGSFLAAQVVADLKNTPGSWLDKAWDWRSWSAPGPGSLKGLNWYFAGGPSKAITARGYSKAISECWQQVKPLLTPELQDLHMQDFQNCLCEFSKWCRVKAGGRARNGYRAGAA